VQVDQARDHPCFAEVAVDLLTPVGPLHAVDHAADPHHHVVAPRRAILGEHVLAAKRRRPLRDSRCDRREHEQTRDQRTHAAIIARSSLRRQGDGRCLSFFRASMKTDEFSHRLLGTGGKIVLNHPWAVLWLSGVRWIKSGRESLAQLGAAHRAASLRRQRVEALQRQHGQGRRVDAAAVFAPRTDGVPRARGRVVLPLTSSSAVTSFSFHCARCLPPKCRSASLAKNQ
jgi:hypothetical protein